MSQICAIEEYMYVFSLIFWFTCLLLILSISICSILDAFLGLLADDITDVKLGSIKPFIEEYKTFIKNLYLLKGSKVHADCWRRTGLDGE